MTDAAPTPSVSTAACLLIGNELLNGKVEDQNLAPLARTLRGRGVRLVTTSVVGDQLEVIAAEVRRLTSVADMLVTSGGVGPTHDDVTLEGIARAFDAPLEAHPTLIAMLQRLYASRCTEAHLKMARVPRAARLLTSDAITWPLVVFRNVWIFPGVPELFRMKLAILQQHVRGPITYYGRHAYTLLEEGDLKTELDRLVALHPEVEIGSYPKWFDARYKTKVTFDAVNEDHVRAAHDAFCAVVPTVDIEE